MVLNFNPKIRMLHLSSYWGEPHTSKLVMVITGINTMQATASANSTVQYSFQGQCVTAKQGIREHNPPKSLMMKQE